MDGMCQGELNKEKAMKYILITILLLASCAPMQFENVAATNTLQQDTYDCRVELGIIGNHGVGRPSQRFADAIVKARDEMQQCMERRGWRRL